eukprot:gene10339-5777_t
MDAAGIPVVQGEQRSEAFRRLTAPLRREEFDKHLRKRAGMAAGLDGCTWDLLQALAPESQDRIFETMKAFLAKGYDEESSAWLNFPQWFRTSWQSVVPKKDPDGTLARCRGISVTPALCRLLGKIINERLVSYVEELGCLSDMQDGFRRGRSTLATVARLQTYLRRLQKAHLLSVDLRRAFDLAEPRLALDYLQRIGVPPMLTSYLRAQLEGSTTQVWTAYGWTASIPVNRGTRQGGVESPLLFTLLVDPILHILHRKLCSSLYRSAVQPQAPCDCEIPSRQPSAPDPGACPWLRRRGAELLLVSLSGATVVDDIHWGNIPPGWSAAGGTAT